jgi:hypothetical protein
MHTRQPRRSESTSRRCAEPSRAAGAVSARRVLLYSIENAYEQVREENVLCGLGGIRPFDLGVRETVTDGAKTGVSG